MYEFGLVGNFILTQLCIRGGQYSQFGIHNNRKRGSE